MKVGAVVQARMSSKRFPGKVLHRLAGKPTLQYVLERLFHCGSLDAVVVATSSDASDTVIWDFCREYGVECYRGPLANVAGRFKEVLDVYKFDSFVRVSGDSPLLDQRLVDKGVDMFLAGDFDLVTNVLPRTYPAGQSVEVVRADTFMHWYQSMKRNEELEHVTAFFYKNKEFSRIRNFALNQDQSHIHLSVDTERDMDIVGLMIERMNKPHWQYELEEIIRLYRDVAL